MSKIAVNYLLRKKSFAVCGLKKKNAARLHLFVKQFEHLKQFFFCEVLDKINCDYAFNRRCLRRKKIEYIGYFGIEALTLCNCNLFGGNIYTLHICEAFLMEIMEHSSMPATKFDNRRRFRQAFESGIIAGVAPFVIMGKLRGRQSGVLLLERAN